MDRYCYSCEHCLYIEHDENCWEWKCELNCKEFNKEKGVCEEYGKE